MKRKNKQNQDWTDIDEGWLYGEWETGPWWGFHTKEKAYATYGWVSIGSAKKCTYDDVLLTNKLFCPTMFGKQGAVPLTFTAPFAV